MFAFNKLVDRVGIEPKLTFKGMKRHKTTLGSFMTIVLEILSILGLIFLGRDIVQKKSPVYFTGKLTNMDPEQISLNSSYFPFLIAIEDPTKNLNYFKDDSIYTVKAIRSRQFRTVLKDGTVQVAQNTSSFNLGNCDLNIHFQGFEDLFNTVDYKNSYCIPPSEQVTLQGTFSSMIYDVFRVQVYQCNNATSKVPCKSQDIIDSKLKTTYLAFSWGDYQSNPSNYSYPMQRQTGNLPIPFSNYYQKRISAEITRSRYQTDTGLITEDTESQSFFMLNNGQFIEQFFPFKPAVSDFLLQLTFRFASVEQISHRSYIKIQNLLAQLGGLYNILYMLSSLIVRILTRNYFYLEILNDNFQIDTKSGYRKPANNVTDQGTNMNSNNNYLEEGTKTNIINEKALPKLNNINKGKIQQKNTKKPGKFLDSKKTILSTTLKENLTFILCPFIKHKNSKFQMIEKARQLIANRMDINLLISNMFEFRKLKKIIFDEHQLAVFKFLSINNFFDVLNEENYNLASGGSQKVDPFKFMQSVKNLDNSKYSKKLLEMCDPQLLESFHQ
jgi:hypothetical protein